MRVVAVVLALASVVTGRASDASAALAEGERLFMLDNWMAAAEHFDRAERLFGNSGDKRNALFARVSRLRAEADQTSYFDVAREIGGVLESEPARNDGDLRLRCLVVKAALDLSLSALLSGVEWREARVLAERLGKPEWVRKADGELAVVEYLQGNTTGAQKLLQTALMNALGAGDKATVVRLLSLASVGMSEIGMQDRALTFASEAIRVAGANKDLRFPIMAYMSKARILDKLGRTDESEKELASAIQFANGANMRVYRADLLQARAEHALRAGRSQEAADLLREAVASASEVRMPRPKASALTTLARIHEQQGHLDEADRLLSEAVQASRELIDMYVFPRQLAAAAALKVKRGKLTEASALYEEASDRIEALLVNTPTTKLRGDLVSAMSTIYEGHLQMVATRQGDVRQAFRIVERARGRSVTEGLRYRSQSGGKNGDEPTRSERELIYTQIRLQQARTADERRSLLAALIRTEQLMIPEVSHRPRYNLHGVVEPVDIGALQRVLREDEVLLEYVIAEPSSFVLAITHTAITHHRLPGRATIRPDIEEYMRVVRQRQEPPVELTARLYRHLLGPVTPAALKRRWILVVDEALHQVPFDALRPPGGGYVSDTVTVSHAPSATALAMLRELPPGAPDRLPLLAAGGVKREGAVEAKQATRGLFDLGGSNVPDLPATAREVREVARRMGSASVVLEGDAATEHALREQPLERFQSIHLAVHGFTDVREAERSALVFGFDKDRAHDGLLQMREIAGLTLDADLVTLSACDTGTGPLRGQEGTANLARAFLVAGARNVAAALWEVDDQFASVLMRQFYDHLRQGHDVSEALRMAKNDLRRRFGANATAFFWGSMIVTGDGRTKLTER